MENTKVVIFDYNASRAFEERLKAEAFPKKLSPEQEILLKKPWPQVHAAGLYQRLREAAEQPDARPEALLRAELGWLRASMPEDRWKTLLYAAEHLTELPYSSGYLRRGFRHRDPALLADRLLVLVREFVNSPLLPQTAGEVLTDQLPEEVRAYLRYRGQSYGYSPWQIARAMDEGDKAVEDAVSKLLIEENENGPRLNRQLLRGVLCCHRPEYYELVGKLLLEAGRQEGLRQGICESADEGTLEAFRYLLGLIRDNELIRFSSVARAVGTWLGMFPDQSNDLNRVNGKTVELLWGCLEEPGTLEACLSSRDSLAVYVALCSLAMRDLSLAEARILDMTDHRQLLAAGWLARNADASRFANRLAGTVLPQVGEDLELAAMWMPSCLSCAGSLGWWQREKYELRQEDWFPGQAEADRIRDVLRELLGQMKKKELRFQASLFPWLETKLEKTDLTDRICLLDYWSGDPERQARACAGLKDCGLCSRRVLLELLTETRTEQYQRNTILDNLAERESLTRQTAIRLSKDMSLSPAEYARILPLLRLKNPETRTAVMDLLLRQGDEALIPCLKGLLADPKEEVRTAALEMAARCAKEGRQAVTAAVTADGGAGARTAREESMLRAMAPAEKAAEEAPLCTKEDRYLPTDFDPVYTARAAARWREVFPDSELPDQILDDKKKGLLKKLTEKLTPKDCPTRKQAVADCESLADFWNENLEQSYRDRNGEEHLISEGRFSLDWREMAEIWERWYRERGMTPERLLRMRLLLLESNSSRKPRNPELVEPWIDTVYGPGFSVRPETRARGAVTYALAWMCLDHPVADQADLGAALGLWFLRRIPEDQVLLPLETQPGISYTSGCFTHYHPLAEPRLMETFRMLNCPDDEWLAPRFAVAAACAERCIAATEQMGFYQNSSGDSWYSRSLTRYGRSLLKYSGIAEQSLAAAPEYLLAAFRGIITPAQFFACVFQGRDLYQGLLLLSGLTAAMWDDLRSLPARGGRRLVSKRNLGPLAARYLGHPLPAAEADRDKLRFAEELYNRAIRPVLAAELSRGEGQTPYSLAVPAIVRLCGVESFVSILKSLGSTTLDRSAYYAWLSTAERKPCLSHLLSVCVPKEGETAADLAAALKGSGISRKRLVEAALYSPAWIDLIGEHLGIPAFRSGCYYFMAHMNESFDEQRMAMIARFTPLTRDELNAGAFDLRWFRSAYEALGEKDFSLIYEAAKYISDGARHTRARKYADAALGRCTPEELEGQITDKRNKDLLMAYPLIPLAGEEDLLRRYLFIQKFARESKQFGAQRAASEIRAAQTALTNLARSAGYDDPMLLTLRMEALAFSSQRDLLAPRTLEGVRFALRFDADGKAELFCERNGKALKSIPAGLKKSPEVLMLTEAKKAFIEQLRRTRTLLEQAMEDQSSFPLRELRALRSHPVVWPMLEKLVFLAGDRAGFLTEEGLADAEGAVFALPEDAVLTLAHPLHLYKQGVWRSFQQALCTRQIVQPFRQVFRELYVKTDEELSATKSLRYAGNQILPAKTCAVLKTRRWVLDVESGLQKIYYKENLVAELWALADWFSPSDVEAPTLEYVVFLDRRSWKPVPLREVPELIFSEVMRDVDLAVSVAHAGGVDPETSHSTVSLRQAMLECLLPILGLENVRVEKQHAFIHGKLADYRIHLGSGVVHQAGGAMIPVLPVHSQHRGRIFLPFADEDPKTAEILAKVLLFAEDGKIKDPAILDMIH